MHLYVHFKETQKLLNYIFNLKELKEFAACNILSKRANAPLPVGDLLFSWLDLEVISKESKKTVKNRKSTVSAVLQFIR